MGYYALLTFASTSPHTHEIHIGQNQNNRVLQLAFPHSRPSQALAAHRPGHKHLWTHSDLSRSNANGKVIKQSRTTNSRLIAGHRRKSSSLLTQFVRTGARKHQPVSDAAQQNAARGKWGAQRTFSQQRRRVPHPFALVCYRVGCYTQAVWEAKASSPHSRRSIYTSKLCLN